MKMTKAELEQRVAELEAANEALEAEVQGQVRVIRDQLDRSWALIAAAQRDALISYVESLPRKTVYRALARALHPDLGGDTVAMQGLAMAWSATRSR